MSHGGGDDSIEPDLTPLLDLVMQLLMFFIINVNFTQNTTDLDTDLPSAGSARPEKNDPAAIFLDLRTLKGVQGQRNRQKLPKALYRSQTKDTIDIYKLMESQDAYVKYSAAGDVLHLYQTKLAARSWLHDQYRAIKSDPKRTGLDSKGNVITTIHIRPDGDLELNQLFFLMQSCKVAGFRNIKIHALIQE